MSAASPSSLPPNRRYLEVEQEELRQLEGVKRQRLLQQKQDLDGQNGCQECLEVFCGRGLRPCWPTTTERRYEDDDERLSCSTAIYALFPCLTIADLVLGQAAKATGAYSRTLADVVCDWSPTACAFWIAAMLAGFGVLAYTVISRLLLFLRKSLCRPKRTATVGQQASTAAAPASIEIVIAEPSSSSSNTRA